MPKPPRLRHPEHYQYDLNLADIAEVWRRGSVIASWLLDLTAQALLGSQDLADFKGRVSDSGEGRWTVDGGYRRVRPSPGDQCRALRSFQLARRGRFRRQGALSDALRVRRPRGKGYRPQRRRLMTASRSDALVLFGVTGDLAHKMIFPASMRWRNEAI